MRKASRLVCASVCFIVLSFMIFIKPGSPAMAVEGDVKLDLDLATSVVEAGAATYPIGYVRLVSNSTGQPILAQSNIEVELLSGDASIAFVPTRVMIPAGSDYARFDIEVSDIGGETDIRAQYGGQSVTKTLKVFDAINLVEHVSLMINLPSDKMQIDSEMPFSVYMESSGNIMQASEDTTVKLDYEESLINVDSDSLVIKKGSYYATGVIKTLEKSGNAFIKATSDGGPNGQFLTTVTNVEIAQTQPVSLKVYVMPDKVGLDDHTIDIFVGVLDASGQPTLAAEDINLEIFSSAFQLNGVDNIPAVIKKGDFGFYTRQYMNFYRSQNVTIGASSSGLGASAATFEVLADSIGPTNPKAFDRAIKVFTIDNVPSNADSIIVYQLNAIEHNDDDLDCNHNGDLTDDGDDCDADGLFDQQRDQNRDGVIDERDWHAMDDLEEGELYPIDSTTIYSQTKGNLDIVTGDNLAAKVVNPGYIASGSSYGTATIKAGREAENVDISVSLSNFAVGTDTFSVIGSLGATKTKIFSPAGIASDGNYRVLFDRDGFTDLFFVTLDSANRPSSSDQGVKYLIKPVNGLTEIQQNSSFTSLRVSEDSFRTNVVVENSLEKINAVPVGVNSDSSLSVAADMHLLFHTGTTIQTLIPFETMVAFTKAHDIGVVQLRDIAGNPVIASDDVAVKLSTSSSSEALPVTNVIVPKGKSFANFDVATFGRADNFTVYAAADGLQSSSVIVMPTVAELPASFMGANTFTATVLAEVSVSTPIPGASIAWGGSSGLEVGNTTSFHSVGTSYIATAKLKANTPGTFTVDATLQKDGFRPTRITEEVVIGQYQKQMNAILIDNGVSKLAYNQPVQMKVLVRDANGIPVPGAQVQVEDSGPQGLMLVSTMITDASGSASFVYTPTNVDKAANLATLMVTAFKDGYQPSRDTTVLDVDSSSAILPPIPVLGNALSGFPSWTSYVILGGIAAVGGGVYLLRKPKSTEDAEALVEDAGIADKEMTPTNGESNAESLEEEDEEEQDDT